MTLQKIKNRHQGYFFSRDTILMGVRMKKQVSKQVNLRLNMELYRKVEHYCTKNGINRSQGMIQLLEKALEKPGIINPKNEREQVQIVEVYHG